ncbi:MAG TPA: amidohydrolase family protein [Cellulomonas sp.]
MGAVDICVGLQTPETVALRPAWAKEFFAGTFHAQDEAVGGMELADYVAVMDEAGVDVSILFSPKAGPRGETTSYRPDPRIVADAVERFPQRFRGIIGIDPTRPMEAIAEIEDAVGSMGFIGVHLYPHWFDLPPDDALWYPIYAKCCELGVPVQLQVGHCLRYTAEKPLRSVGRPITLDTVACHFPELTLIGIHTGWPWTEEMIAVAYKHPNVHIGLDAYAPRYLDPKLVHFMNTFGSDKVMFGTDYPTIDPRRAMTELRGLGLRESSLEKVCSGNARRVYDLP